MTYMRKNYITLIKEIEELNKWIDTLYSLIGRFNITKSLFLPNLTIHSTQSQTVSELFCEY